MLLNNETDFFIRSVDLLTALFGAIGEKAGVLVAESTLPILISEFIEVKDFLIKQYIFSLVGDMQKNLSDYIKI
jgi:hypothetical protein